MSFSRFQDIALFHPQAGFYSSLGSAGRHGDFITSPELGNLFAQVIAEALDRWWRKLGRPDPFFVIEAGAGTGTLAVNILEAEPMCLQALRYVTVERSSSLRIEQTGRLPLQPADEVLGLVSTRVRGPLVTALDRFPEGVFTGIVLANELLDNLPVDIYERRGRRWYEVRVEISNEGGLAEILVPTDEDPVEDELRRLAPGVLDTARVPVQREAAQWLRSALDILDRGKVVIFDYFRSTTWMAHNDWEDWLRTYRGHRPGVPPLESPGSQDITCEVAIDQLADVRPPDRDRTQTEFLEAFGLADLVAEAREAWHARAAIGDLGAARARSRVNEGRALTDVNGLGRYRVLEWDIPHDPAPDVDDQKPISTR